MAAILTLYRNSQLEKTMIWGGFITVKGGIPVDPKKTFLKDKNGS